MSDYVTKPVSLEALRAALERAVEPGVRRDG
jgi:CheY-like chemotaxis protein